MSPEYVDDPELNQRAAARKKEAAEKKESNRTLAEQIMLNADAQRIEVDLHGIPVMIRAPLSAEVAEFQEAALQGNSDRFAEMLADFCIDESLDADFFRDGLLTQADARKLAEAITGVDPDMVARLRDFRHEQRRRRSA